MFDTRRFLEEKFGTPDAVVGLASTHNVPMPSRDTVRKWFERGALSGGWWPVLVSLLEIDEGRPVVMAVYMQREKADDIFA